MTFRNHGKKAVKGTSVLRRRPDWTAPRPWPARRCARNSGKRLTSPRRDGLYVNYLGLRRRNIASCAISRTCCTVRLSLGSIACPTYKAPVEDVAVPAERRLPDRALQQPAGLRRRDAGRGRGDPRRGREALRGGARAAQPGRRPRGLHAPRRRHASRRRRASRRPTRPMREGGWMGLSAPAGIRRPGPALRAQRRRCNEFVSSANMALRHVSGPDAGRDRGAPRPRHATSRSRPTCRRWSSGDWTGTMNLTEPHCGTDLGLHPDQGGAERRRLLRDHRHQDLHLGRRARPRREHRPPRARPHRGRAGGHQGHLALRRAEVPASTPDGSLGDAQRRLLRRRSSTRWASTATPPAS